jgi:hypothetical protein
VKLPEARKAPREELLPKPRTSRPPSDSPNIIVARNTQEQPQGIAVGRLEDASEKAFFIRFSLSAYEKR